jgi:hypothetical protein
MPVEDVRMDEMVHSNLIADAGNPLLSETIRITTELPLGSIIARDPVTGDGSLVTAATEAQTFGILRDNVFAAGELYVVYVSGAFIKDTLKTDADTSVDNVEPRLREFGIYCRPSTHYPTSPPPPVATRPWIESLAPSSAAAGSGPLTLTASGDNFSVASVIVTDGADQATTLVDVATLTNSVSPVAPPREVLVFVRDGGQTSNTMVFVVT